MSPLHDESGQVQCPDDLIESELLLSDFLHEMDEIDFQHSFTQQLCSNLQEPQELEAEVKLDFKTTPTEATTTENVLKPVPTKSEAPRGCVANKSFMLSDTKSNL
ncbi:unnamed protein product [Phytophthora lilii]|uniref:Unnamed protein product n=1 Tax=Phytophthora lilii TaxID=2077276 RepID=A0A9W6U6C1_9STRA|nr:unnamed protein product [Phytophthora lilii]